MARFSPLVFLPPVVFAALAVLFYTGMGREGQNEMPSTREGGPAPLVAVTPLGGKPELTDTMIREGGPKLVNYWASWCAPCRVEHPFLVELGAQGIPIYGVNFKDDPAKALGFLEELGDPYAAIGADTQGRMALNWGVYGVPETYVIDGDGRVVLRFAGPITAAAYESQILPALEAARAAR
jgi:cytochrome c biogenesis protein CcmG/thiol:disulfide interchange protein DsbE